MLFSELGLGPEVLRAVEDAGYTQPTPIQAQAIPYVLQGRDLLGCAQTGTGKTASFTLPMIEILATGRARARMPRSLILEPTRELAAQVAENFETYGKHHKLSMALLIGGESFGDQVKRLERGVDVLIATPGRMIDLFERGNILLTDIKVLVIDEADRMLDMGFIPDIERIVSLLPKMRQTLFFSATMPPEIRRLADAFLLNPKEVTVAPPASAATTVTQALALVHKDDKRAALRHLLRTEDIKNALIFCNRKRDIGTLQRSLTRHGFNVASLHGDLPQSLRTETLERFKKGEINILVCSDVAARGIDVAGLSHVFNFDVPIHSEDYVHRIGRTGRAGRSGRAFTLATPDEGKYVEAITRLIQSDIPRVSIGDLETPEFEETSDKRRRHGKGKADKKTPPREQSAQKEQTAEQQGGHRRQRAEAEERPVTDRPRHQPAQSDQRPRHQPSESRPDRDRGRRHHREDPRDEEPVIGFGDHMPAFLLRPARPQRDKEA